MIVKSSVYMLLDKKLILKLFKDSVEYGIICVQADNLCVTEDICRVSNISPNRRDAYRIFTRIVKYKAFSCSICEIIEDMIC